MWSTTPTWLRLCPSSLRPAPRDAGEEVGAGVALHKPIADVGQTLRVGDGHQQLRQAFGGGQSEARRRHAAQQRSFAIKPLLKPLFESLLDPC